MGCIAIGAGGLDVAKAMAGIGYRLTCPKVVEVKLTGTLAHGVSSKDIILKLLDFAKSNIIFPDDVSDDLTNPICPPAQILLNIILSFMIVNIVLVFLQIMTYVFLLINSF